jgi:hypothetical protein
MNPQKDTFAEALRELAAASPQASPELGGRLNREFARHHVRRRRKRAAVVIGLTACLAISVYWFRPRNHSGAVKAVAPAPQTAQAPPAPKVVAPELPKAPPLPVAGTRTQARVRTKPISRPRNSVGETPPARVEEADFVALPTFDPAIPLGESRVVRMDLPGSDLQLIGYPIDGQLFDRRILTDVLVGQDGMPYAVRLVETRNVH